jgi:branched-chain amino acid transport system substrate-binding protein
MKKIVLVIIVVIIIILIANGLSRDQKTGLTQQIKIGGMFSLSGYAAFAGEASRDGFLLAIEDSGKDIPYVVEDFKSDSKTAVTAAQKLINVDKVSVVIGPEWADFVDVIAPIATEKKIPFISPWMAGEVEGLKSPYYFSGTPSGRVGLRALVKYLSENNIKKIVTVYSNNAWSLNNIPMFKEEAAKAGITILSEFKFNPETSDFRTEILKIKNLGPDGVYSAIATDDDHGNFSKQIKEFEVTVPIYTDISRAESPVIRDRFLQYVEGQIYAAPVPYKNTGAFVKKYEKRFNKKPGAISAAVAYDMTTIVLNAIKSGAKNSEDVRKYLENTKNYDGYSNLITFDELGQVKNEEIVIKMITKEGSEVLR